MARFEVEYIKTFGYGKRSKERHHKVEVEAASHEEASQKFWTLHFNGVRNQPHVTGCSIHRVRVWREAQGRFVRSARIDEET